RRLPHGEEGVEEGDERVPAARLHLPLRVLLGEVVKLLLHLAAQAADAVPDGTDGVFRHGLAPLSVPVAVRPTQPALGRVSGGHPPSPPSWGSAPCTPGQHSPHRCPAFCRALSVPPRMGRLAATPAGCYRGPPPNPPDGPSGRLRCG